jgi:hypothetical protein
MPQRATVEEAVTRVSKGVLNLMISCCPKNTGPHAINRPSRFRSSGMMLSFTRLKPWPRPDDAATIHLTGITFPLPSIDGTFDSQSRSSSRGCQHLTRRSAISMASKFSSRATGARFCRLRSVAAVVPGRANGGNSSCQAWTYTCAPTPNGVPICWSPVEVGQPDQRHRCDRSCGRLNYGHTLYDPRGNARRRRPDLYRFTSRPFAGFALPLTASIRSRPGSVPGHPQTTSEP